MILMTTSDSQISFLTVDVSVLTFNVTDRPSKNKMGFHNTTFSSDELHNLCSSPGDIKSRRMTWAGHVRATF
jgi:hypothetical protein